MRTPIYASSLQYILLNDSIRCKKCKGTKTVKEKTRQEIYVERGMADRQRIVLAGAGDEEVSLHLVSFGGHPLIPAIDISRAFLQEM